jgi:hypothetical protein
MKVDVTGKKELLSLKFDWKLYSLDSSTTKCCAGGTRSATAVRIAVRRDYAGQAIPMHYDAQDAKEIACIYGYLRK